MYIYIYVITVCVCSIYMSKYRPQSGRFFFVCVHICIYLYVQLLYTCKYNIYIYNYIYVTETTNSCFQPQTIERNGSQQIFPQFHYALGAPGSKALRKTVLFLKQDHVFFNCPVNQISEIQHLRMDFPVSRLTTVYLGGWSSQRNFLWPQTQEDHCV